MRWFPLGKSLQAVAILLASAALSGTLVNVRAAAARFNDGVTDLDVTSQAVSRQLLDTAAPCGALGQACCPGELCGSSDLACRLDRCRTCGARLAPACVCGGTIPCDEGLTERFGICTTDFSGAGRGDPNTDACPELAPAGVPPELAAYTITSCSPGTLVLQSTTADAAPLEAGDVLWDLDASGSLDDCTDCAQWGSVVAAVATIRPCASGSAPCIEVEVSTRPATIAEVLEEETLAALRPSVAVDVDSTTFYDLLGCTATSRRRRRLAGMATGGDSSLEGFTPYVGRSLLQAVPRPQSCDEWTNVGSDGRCRYSDCFVGNDPIPADPNCFNCAGNECDNGCGTDGLNAIITDDEAGVFDFGEACCSHDHCYSSPLFSKPVCDRGFLDDMRADCAQRFADLEGAVRPLVRRGRNRLTAAQNSLLDRFIARDKCYSRAGWYYFGVRDGTGFDNFFSDVAYANAQDTTRDWERGDECVAQCPSTQRSGGQGTTVLRVDVLRTSGTFPVSYNMFSIPDALDITYEGATIFSTGGLVSGSRSTTVTFSGQSTIVTATIDAPNSGTAWDVFIGCAITPNN